MVLHGEGLEESAAFARELAEQRGLYLVHPYDDPEIIAGQGTIALEMLATHPDLEVLVLPVGGGGLIAGNAIAARALRPDIEIVESIYEHRAFEMLGEALDGARPSAANS